MKWTWWGRCLLLVLLLSTHLQAQDINEPVVVTWFTGLGTGNGDEQRIAEEKVAADFNASQSKIELQLICGCLSGPTPTDQLATLIALGEAPDIVGPISPRTAREHEYEWLDLQPLVDKTGYDLSQFPSNLVDIYRESDGLFALPFSTFPGVLYYNADLFDAAGLNYPPTTPHTPYIMPNGKELPWDYDTLTILAQRLTLDANGRTANHHDFDPETIVQYGFDHQWDNLLSDFHTFGAAPLLDDTGQVIIHENWRAQARWMWDEMWTSHVMPNLGLAYPGDLNLFGAGKVAMTRSMLWYTCCLDTLDARWDLAIQPAYQGQIYAPIDVDSFYISKSSAHPDEAFTVLQYLLGEAVMDLLDVYYDGFPARPELYDEALKHRAELFPEVQNWDVVVASIPLAPTPHHEVWLRPSWRIRYRFEDFLYTLRGVKGYSMDLEAELDQLEKDIQAIVDGEVQP